jgi:predicted secreted hydrolase
MRKFFVGSLLVAVLLASIIYTACAKKEPFSFASPQYTLAFPKDHAAHNDFRTEWWYYTGHLKSGARQFGYELTFFRAALAIEEADATRKQIYFAHFAITDESNKKFYHTERQSRGNFGDAGASEQYYKTFIGNWSVQDLGPYQLIQAETDSFALALILEPTKPPVLQGEKGYSRKGSDPKNASMYYSYTRLKSVGALTLNGMRYTVEGESWKDHEFGTSQIEENVAGWDWFSIQLSDTTELMLYTLRLTDGTKSPYSSGTFVYSNGTSEKLSAGDFKIEVQRRYTSKKSGAEYPVKWTISVPKLSVLLNVEATVEDQELLTEESTRITYWEGSTTVSGTKAGAPISGKGYTELTGYAKKITAF